MPNIALIRGYGGEPLCRAVDCVANGVVFVASSRSKSVNYQGFPPPIGVPASDVFIYTDAAFERLRGMWKKGITPAATDWGESWEMKEGAN